MNALAVDYKTKIKNINIVSYIFIALVVLFIMILPSVSADMSLGKIPEYMANTVMGGAMPYIKKMFSGQENIGQMFTDVVGSGSETGDGIVTYVGLDNFYTKILKACGALLIICIAIARIVFNIDKGHDSTEAVYKGLIEICVAGFFMINIDKILGMILAIGYALIPDMTTPATATMSGKELLKGLTDKDEGSFGWWMQSFGILLIPWFATLIINIAARFAFIEIVVEIIIRRIFSPLAVCDIYAEGMRSGGVRYLKKYFACVLKFSICVVASLVVIKLNTALMTNIDWSGDGLVKLEKIFEFIVNMLALNFVGVMAMFKAGTYANDIVGA